jgi:hypothetical protein
MCAGVKDFGLLHKPVMLVVIPSEAKRSRGTSD